MARPKKIKKVVVYKEYEKIRIFKTFEEAFKGMESTFKVSELIEVEENLHYMYEKVYKREVKRPTETSVIDLMGE